jgi:purine-binding chemotaxis protein CheW
MVNIRHQQRSLGTLLIEQGLLATKQLDLALAEQKKTGQPLGRILVKNGWVREKDIVAALQGLMLVVFTLGGEEFGMETLFVREIIRYKTPVELPGSATYFDGIINFRDHVVPVLDLRKRFGELPATVTEETRIIVFEKPEKYAGLLVDSVKAVIQVEREQIENAPAVAVGVPEHYLYGLARLGERVVTILDIESILDSTEAINLNKAKTGGVFETEKGLSL